MISLLTWNILVQAGSEENYFKGTKDKILYPFNTLFFHVLKKSIKRV